LTEFVKANIINAAHANRANNQRGEEEMRTVLLTISAMILVFNQGCGNEPGTPNQVSDNGGINRVVFESPMSPETTSAILDKAGVVPMEIITSYGNHQAGYRIAAGVTVEEAAQSMKRKHEEFLAEATATLSESLSDPSTTKEDAARMQVLYADIVNLQRNFQENGLKITGMTATDRDIGLLKGLTTFTSTPIPARVIDDNPTADATEGDGARTAKIYSFYHETWAPSHGTSKVTTGITFQTLYFNNISAFGSTSTYECETQVYDKNFADYDNYWASNLPSAYYDTPFLDTIDNFTVGSAQASNIVANVQYYTSMSLRAGSAPTATVRIKGQLGHRFPSWCYSTWCIFADATTGSIMTFTAPMYGASWQY
jgi:hypothetical protein